MTPDPKLRANHNTYHPAVEVLKQKLATVTDEQLEILPSALLLSQSGLSFIAIEQSGVVPSQNFGVQPPRQSLADSVPRRSRMA